MTHLGVLSFSGNETITFQKSIWDLADTFTYEFWVKAEAEQTLDAEQERGVSGLHGKRYLINPEYRAPGDAGMGIAVGSNGISVHEHTLNDIPAKLVYPCVLSEWQHVAVVYNNKTPSLYLNGNFVKEGLPSPYLHVYPSLKVGGHVYGNFVGKISHLRLWSTARTEAEIRNNMYKEIDWKEPNLYWHWNPRTGRLITGIGPTKVKVSVIMPSHNRCPLNYFALRTLEKQTYPPDQMEVIFLDDGSTDNTGSILDSLNPKFSFKFVRLDKPIGRSAVRNLGIRLASGSVFLFLDGEMLCPADMIEKHMRYHEDGNPVVVSGSMKVRQIYTVADPGLSEHQIWQMKHLFQGNDIAESLIDRFIHADRTPVQLLPVELMSDRAEMDRWSSCYDYFNEILDVHGPHFTEFHYSWMNFITSNVSLPRFLMEQAGLFDEGFEGYGWEDWELGFRLYRKGASFIHDDEVVNYHQEHPRPNTNLDQSRRNFLKFVHLHPVPEIRLMVLDMIPERRSMVSINVYLTELIRLRAIYTGRYEIFYNFVMEVLERLSYMLSVGADIYMPLPDHVIDTGSLRTAYAKAEAESIKSLGLFPNLMELFDLLYGFATKEHSQV